jgi:hypothetical protein
MSHINVANPPIPPQPESLWERWYDAAHVALRQAECLVSEARVLESALDDLLELQEQSRNDEVHKLAIGGLRGTAQEIQGWAEDIVQALEEAADLDPDEEERS